MTVSHSTLSLIVICWLILAPKGTNLFLCFTSICIAYVPWLLAFFGSLINNNCFTSLILMFKFSCLFKNNLVGKFLTPYSKEDCGTKSGTHLLFVWLCWIHSIQIIKKKIRVLFGLDLLKILTYIYLGNF